MSTLCDRCGAKRHRFDFLKGDLILLGGFYGSELRNKSDNSYYWRSLFRLGSAIAKEFNAEDYIPSG